MRKFLSAILVLCLVFGMSSESSAAKKKSSKQKSSGDVITQILRKYKPENKTNAQTIRDILKKYKQSHIFVITLDDDYGMSIECVSAKNGASKGKVPMTFDEGAYYTENPKAPELWKILQNACIFEHSGTALRFYKARIKSEIDFEPIRDEYLIGIEAFNKLLDKNDLFFEDKFPFILKYLETGI